MVDGGYQLPAPKMQCSGGTERRWADIKVCMDFEIHKSFCVVGRIESSVQEVSKLYEEDDGRRRWTWIIGVRIVLPPMLRYIPTSWAHISVYQAVHLSTGLAHVYMQNLLHRFLIILFKQLHRELLLPDQKRYYKQIARLPLSNDMSVSYTGLLFEKSILSC